MLSQISNLSTNPEHSAALILLELIGFSMGFSFMMGFRTYFSIFLLRFNSVGKLK